MKDIKGIRDTAEVLRQYAAQAGAGLEAQNKCAEIKLRAERKAGEVLKKVAPHGGNRKSSSTTSNLKNLGVSNLQSANWQQAASVPEAKFEAHIARTKEACEEGRSGEKVGVWDMGCFVGDGTWTHYEQGARAPC